VIVATCDVPRATCDISKIDGGRGPGGGRVVHRVYEQEPKAVPLEGLD